MAAAPGDVHTGEWRRPAPSTGIRTTLEDRVRRVKATAFGLRTAIEAAADRLLTFTDLTPSSATFGFRGSALRRDLEFGLPPHERTIVSA